jgi:hypothetical protein
MDNSPECQQAVDEALSQQVKDLRGFVQALAEDTPQFDIELDRKPTLAIASQQFELGVKTPMDPLAVRDELTISLRQVLTLDPAQQIPTMKAAIARLDKPAEAQQLFGGL